MAEALGAAATLISIIGFSAQVFDGCIKGFVLLSTANNLGRDGDILRSRLDWEQFRLEQWAEKARLHDPAKADMLVDWDLVTKTLEHIRNLTNDTRMLKEKYKLVIEDEPPGYEESEEADGEQVTASVSRFKRLFGASTDYNSTAAAKVIQTKNSRAKKLRWAAIDKKSMQSLIEDISHFVQRLHDTLDSSIQAQMHTSLEFLLQEATNRYSNVPDLEYLKELAASLRTHPVNVPDVEADALDKQIEKKLTNLLFHAIRKNKIDDLIELLDKGISVQVQDQAGWPPLLKAAEYNHLSMVQLLLKRGADPSKGTIGNRLPIHFAAEEGHTEVVRLLLSQTVTNLNTKDHTGDTPIFKAAHHGREAVVRLLLDEEGIDPNPFNDSGFTPLVQTIFGDHTPIVSLLLARPDVSPNEADRMYKQTPLWMAAPVNDGEMVKVFLTRKDLDIDAPSRFGETALVRCARQSYHASAQLLIDAKADVNINANFDKRTPLCAAVVSDNETGVEMFLKHPEVAVDTADRDGRTPLHHAAITESTKLIKLLLAHNASVDTPDNDGNSPLALAAANGHKIAVKLLLKSKANINSQNRKGNTPLALAAEKEKNDAVVRFLLEQGADAERADEDEETPFEKARDQRLERIVDIFREVLQV